MLKLITLLSLLVTSAAFATDIIKVIDGGSTTCHNKIDFLRNQTNAIYRPISFTRTENSSLLSVEFYRCVDKGNNEYGFEKVNSINSTEVKTVQSPYQPISRTVTIDRNIMTLTAYNARGRVLAQNVLLQRRNGVYQASLDLNEGDLDFTFVGASFEFNVFSLTTITDKNTGLVIDSGREFLGSYGLIVK